MHKAPDVAHAPAIPVATAVLAVLAAIGSVVSNHTANAALSAKNEAILARSHASDAFTAREAHMVREQIYEAALETGSRDPATRKRLGDIVKLERGSAELLYASAKENEARSVEASDRSEGLTHAHDQFDVAIALLEIAVAIVSISALASSWYLAGFAGLCAVAGVIVGIIAQFRAMAV